MKHISSRFGWYLPAGQCVSSTTAEATLGQRTVTLFSMTLARKKPSTRGIDTVTV